MTNRITQVAPHETLIMFDKDGVLLDLNATWLPAIAALGAYLEGRCDGATSRDAFLAAAGVMMKPGTDEGIILENSLFAAGTFAEMRDVWQDMEPRLAPVFADIQSYRHDVTQLMAEAVRGKTVPMGMVKDGIARLKDAATYYGAAEAAGYRCFITISHDAPQKPDFIPRSDAVVACVNGLADWLDV